MRAICAAISAGMLFSSAAFAQIPPPPSVTAHATAQIAAALQIQCTAMHFSSLIALHTATYLVLPADGSAIVDPSNIILPGTGQDAKATTCTASGDVAATYNVSVPSSVILTNRTGKTMVLNSFTLTSDGDTDPYNRLLRNDGTGLGTDNFGVGAKLNVSADQAPGTYRGTYAVNVQYN
jgi:hypothetical protein